MGASVASKAFASRGPSSFKGLKPKLLSCSRLERLKPPFCTEAHLTVSGCTHGTVGGPLGCTLKYLELALPAYLGLTLRVRVSQPLFDTCR